MSKSQKYLIGILGLQIVLIFIVFLLQRPVAASNNLVLPDLTIESVSEISISDSAGNIITMQNKGDQWVLPQQDDFPVLSNNIQQLVEKLATIRDNRLVTRSETSHDRLNISDKNYERKVEITLNGKKEVIFFGSSPAANTIHFRMEGKPEVYLTNAITTTQISTTYSSWVATIVFQISSANVTKIEVTSSEGVFVFDPDPDTSWTSAQVAEGNQFDQSKWSSLLTGFTNLRFVEPVSMAEKAEYGLETPQAVMKIEYSNETSESITGELVIGSPDGLGNYYAKWSESAYIYKISSFNAERFINLSADDFSSPIATEENGNG